MKKSRSHILKVFLLFLFLFIAGGITLGGWYMRYLEGVVTAKFEGRKWRFPSKIYSDTLLLYLGMNLRSEDLWEKLRRLGYHEVRELPKARGDYRFLNK